MIYSFHENGFAIEIYLNLNKKCEIMLFMTALITVSRA